MSKAFLRSLKETIEDIPRDIYNQINFHLKNDGVFIDLKCHFKLKEFGSYRENRIFMDGGSLCSPEGLLKALSEEIKLIKESDLDLLYDPEDYSRIIDLRKKMSSICLFDDAMYSFQFFDSKKNPLSIKMNLEDLNQNKILLEAKPAFLNIKEEKTSLKQSYKFEFLTHSHDRVIQDAFRVLNRLVIGRGVNDHTFPLLEKILCKNSLGIWDFSSKEDFLRTWGMTRKSNFSSWDFYDWAEIIFSFSVQGDFSNYKKARRLRDRWVLKSLKDDGVFFIPLTSKVHKLNSFI